jgi:hypothetical protein
MTNINQPNLHNLGGVLRFNFVDVNDVLSIPIPTNSILFSALSLKPGKQWYAGYGTLGTMSYTEPSELTSAGTLFKRLFVASCPKDGYTNSNLFNEMRNKQFLLDYTDSNGFRKLIGSIDEPLFFDSVLNTKSKMAELSGSVIRFYGDGSHKAYEYRP